MAPILSKLKTFFGGSSPNSGNKTNAATHTSNIQTTGTTSAAAQAIDPDTIPETIITPPTPFLSTPAGVSTSIDPMTKQASGEPAGIHNHTDTAHKQTNSAQPKFDNKDVTVVFVLGGPGAGKGTQCAKLVEDYGFVHLSAGDLLRAEQQRAGSEYGAMIKEYITEGKIVPMEVTVALLSNAMAEKIKQSGASSGHRFLVDGFPRKMDQAHKFDDTVCASSLVLFLVCPEPILLERLLERGKTSGRDDDNKESIKKRFQTFIDTSMPVVDYYKKLNKVVEIDSSKSIDDVYADIRKGIEPILKK